MEHRMLLEEGQVHLCLLVGIDLFRFDACTRCAEQEMIIGSVFTRAVLAACCGIALGARIRVELFDSGL